MILETIRIAINSLRANKMRTFLSMLGIIIGVGAVIAIVSIGSGAQQRVTGRISSLGSNLINIMPGVSRGHWGRVSRSEVDLFTLQLGDDIKRYSPSVKMVVPNIQGSGLLVNGNNNIQATVVGTEEGFCDVNNYYPAEGQFISNDDVNASRNVMILGSQLASDIFADKDPIGANVKFNYGNRSFLFTVVGVMEEKGSGMMGNFDDRAYIPVTTFMNKISNTRYVTSFFAQSESSDKADEAVGQIKYFLTRYLGDADKFRIISQDQLLEVMSQVTGTFSLMLGGIAGISLLVGGIGIMNIMLVSVTERTREIGIRKALGAKKSNILSQFLIESLSLSGFGGICGIALGWLGAYLIARVAGWALIVTPFSIIVAFGFALLIGLFFGIYPAMKAAKLDPVQALSYE